MFSRFKIENNSKAIEIYNAVKLQSQKIKDIPKTIQGNFLLKPELLGTLQGYMHGFKELRVFCTKPWHGRTLDIVINLEDPSMAKLASGGGNIAHEDRVDQCSGRSRFLSDDSSLMSTKSCSQILTYENYHANVVYVTHYYHVIIKENRIECDDKYSNGGFDSRGRWFFYVR